MVFKLLVHFFNGRLRLRFLTIAFCLYILHVNRLLKLSEVEVRIREMLRQSVSRVLLYDDIFFPILRSLQQPRYADVVNLIFKHKTVLDASVNFKHLLDPSHLNPPLDCSSEKQTAARWEHSHDL